jgi:hypothetical protein
MAGCRYNSSTGLQRPGSRRCASWATSAIAPAPTDLGRQIFPKWPKMRGGGGFAPYAPVAGAAVVRRARDGFPMSPNTRNMRPLSTTSLSKPNLRLPRSLRRANAGQKLAATHLAFRCAPLVRTSVLSKLAWWRFWVVNARSSAPGLRGAVISADGVCRTFDARIITDRDLVALLRVGPFL